jgi:hypothetical protein
MHVWSLRADVLLGVGERGLVRVGVGVGSLVMRTVWFVCVV